MLCWSRKITKNYALELSGFHLIRRLKDGLTGLEVTLNWDRYKGDHKPQATFMVVVLNLKIVEINFYNVNHVDVAE